MKVNRYKYKFCLHKGYFEKGYALSHYIFKLIAVVGLTSNQITSTIYAIIVYTLLCYLGGCLWYRWGFIVAEQEVSNKFNLFVREMRKQLKAKRFK